MADDKPKPEVRIRRKRGTKGALFQVMDKITTKLLDNEKKGKGGSWDSPGRE